VLIAALLRLLARSLAPECPQATGPVRLFKLLAVTSVFLTPLTHACAARYLKHVVDAGCVICWEANALYLLQMFLNVC
jgi:hypothetical protein